MKQSNPNLPLRPVVLSLLLTAALAGGACSDDEPEIAATRNDASADGAADATTGPASDAAAAEAGSTDGGDEAGTVDPDAGASDAGGTAATSPAPVGIAVLSSDHKSTALSLLALDGTQVLLDQCFHSGSQSPQLSAALSGDVVLPSAPQPRNEIALIDRKNGTITWLAAETCAVLRQMNVGPGFSANPYDLVGNLPGGKGYVARYGTDPGNPAVGSDLLIIDTDKATATGRIDLRAFAPAVAPPGQPLLPDPARLAAIAGKVYVLLNNLSADYNTAGVGRLVAIDPATDAPVGMIDLPGLSNCGALQAITGPAGAALVVGCSGPFLAGPAQIESAGIAWVDVLHNPPVVTVVKSGPFGRPVSGFDVGVQDAALGFTVVNGEFGMPPTDAIWLFDFQGTAPKKIYEADSSFTLSLKLDRDRRRLFILDASKTNPKVRILTLPVGGVPVESGTFVSNPAAGLPPRLLALH
jgi:hypothetical protein